MTRERVYPRGKKEGKMGWMAGWLAPLDQGVERRKLWMGQVQLMAWPRDVKFLILLSASSSLAHPNTRPKWASHGTFDRRSPEGDSNSIRRHSFASRSDPKERGQVGDRRERPLSGIVPVYK